LSNKDIVEEVKIAAKTVEPKTDMLETSDHQDVEESFKTPEPKAIGNGQVSILKHNIYLKHGDHISDATSIELSVINISNNPIGSILFEAELYDIDGNTLDTVEQKIFDFEPGIKRKVFINYSGLNSDKVKSYCIRIAKVVMTPEPVATGNESVIILNHSLNLDLESGWRTKFPSIDLSIRSASSKTIASVTFEIILYDIEGNTIDAIYFKEIDIRPNTSRALYIPLIKQGAEKKLRSYNIKIARMTTTDVEKGLLLRQDKNTTDEGEELRGIVKNISDVRTDTALVATFFNSNKENIGTKVIILKDIEPNKTKPFYFKFKSTEADEVKSYILNIGDIV
jgi:hypothetical protein